MESRSISRKCEKNPVGALLRRYLTFKLRRNFWLPRELTGQWNSVIWYATAGWKTRWNVIQDDNALWTISWAYRLLLSCFRETQLRAVVWFSAFIKIQKPFSQKWILSSRLENHVAIDNLSEELKKGHMMYVVNDLTVAYNS